MRLATFLREHVDADEIDRTGEIPDAVIHGLAELGAFGIKIPEEYGGLGLSQQYYSRAAMLLGSHCGNTAALLSAHQSIGVPQPLLLFGTEEQKRRFLPRLARGRDLGLRADRGGRGLRSGADGDHAPSRRRTARTSCINGRKLWCTNGTQGRPARRDGQDPAQDRARPHGQPDHRLHRRGRHARA